MQRMAQHKLRSRIAQFKQPFLVGAVTSAALLSGCGGETSGTGVNPGELNGREEDCPAQVPESGATCADYVSGLSCEYNSDSCSRELRCEGGEWEDHSPTCNPPPPEPSDECPEAMPTAGEGCYPYEADLNCVYGADSSCPREFTCSDGDWVDNSPSCNPPPVSGNCPTQAPSHNGDCSELIDGLVCDYVSDSNCGRSFECNQGTWLDMSPTCNPPPPELSSECPTELPAAGVTCSGYELGLNCIYDDPACASGGGTSITCVNGDWQANPISCNPPPPVMDNCPADKPQVDTSCAAYQPGVECEYDTDTSCPNSYRCTDAEWESTTLPCNPPPPLTECPTDIPVSGDSCEDYQVGLECGEANCDGGVAARCDANGTWLTFDVIGCNPPDWGPDPEPGDAGVDSAVPSGD